MLFFLNDIKSNDLFLLFLKSAVLSDTGQRAPEETLDKGSNLREVITLASFFSATPRIISKAREDHQGAADKRRLPVVPLNDLEPITNIQIWLADGERIIQKFNVSHR